MKFFFALIILFLISMSVFVFDAWPRQGASAIASFEHCVNQGFPVFGGNTSECRTDGGEVFFGHGDQIRVIEPQADTVISSPITVIGEAPASWFSNGRIPLRLVATGTEDYITEGYVEAIGEVSNTALTPFRGVLLFSSPSSTKVTLVLEHITETKSPHHLRDSVSVPLFLDGSVNMVN